MKKKGFTLIEIIVAVAILAIVAVPIARAIINSAKTNRQSTDMIKATQLCQQKMEDIKTAISAGADPLTQHNFLDSTDLNPAPTAGAWIVKSTDNNYYIKYEISNPTPEDESNGASNSPVTYYNPVSPVNISSDTVITIDGDNNSATVTPGGNVTFSGNNNTISIYLNVPSTVTSDITVSFKNLDTSVTNINAIVKGDKDSHVKFTINPDSQGNPPSIDRYDESSATKTADKKDSIYDIKVKVYKVKDVSNLSNIDSLDPLAAGHSERLDRR